MTHPAPTIQQQLADWFMRGVSSSGVRRVKPLAAAAATDTGTVRRDNQDRVAVARGRTGDGLKFAIAAVADGIGGMKEGAWCASNALAELLSSVFCYLQDGDSSKTCLEQAVRDANDLVHFQSGLTGGTTLVALLIVEGSPPCWTSVGDSRLYLVTDKLVQLSKDDTIAGQLGRRANIALEQSKLLQFVGVGEQLEIYVENVFADQEDTALLTTDGVHFLERSGGVFDLVVHNSPDVGTCVKRLTELARWAGGPDNASAVAIPLFHDFSEFPILPHSLEVWDAFGELRISTRVERRAEKSRRQWHSKNAVPYGETEIASEEVLAAEVKIHEIPSNIVKPDPKKKKRKPRKKIDLTESNVPQVQLKFSGKDD
ncbi:PP2C family protein-serine/threonine phosphatase [Xanthomonas dyei]|uniref:PP2C family protein-serine/threonine phosphatase n=1 Tax=Xanthomonas dyei TaxID=743699 RepID=UPI001374FF9D|nr:PP2C family serine/threonine-protein phosphatase [Xanthomonas dyei]